MKNLTTLILSLLGLMLMGCGGHQQPKSFNNVITGNDSVAMMLGDGTMEVYHSEALGLDIPHPSCLVHQEFDDSLQEVFVGGDVSISVIAQYYDDEDIFRSAGQQMQGMGAELLEAGDDYSVHTGQEGDFEYYAKVVEDSARLVTIILRYYPDHAEGVEPLKQLVRDFKPTK